MAINEALDVRRYLRIVCGSVDSASIGCTSGHRTRQYEGRRQSVKFSQITAHFPSPLKLFGDPAASGDLIGRRVGSQHVREELHIDFAGFPCEFRLTWGATHR